MDKFDVLDIQAGDIIYYLAHEDGKFYMEKGSVKEDNIYEQGVEVHGDGWHQYVSKYFIQKIERGDQTIYKTPDFDKLIEEE